MDDSKKTVVVEYTLTVHGSFEMEVPAETPDDVLDELANDALEKKDLASLCKSGEWDVAVHSIEPES